MAQENKGGGSLTAGVAGAIVGAAAAAAAIALSNEKNRKKAEEVLQSLEKQGSNLLKEITKRALEIKDAVGKSSTEEEPKKLKAKSK